MQASYVDHMGTDMSVVDAARVSFAKKGEWYWDPIQEVWFMTETDRKLIRYLARYNHWTPFAHTAITLRMQAPVPIRTQCFKHKYGFVENEESRRYISTTPELFIPYVFRSKADSVKQGSGGKHYNSFGWLFDYEVTCRQAISLYERMIEDGICPEQARFVLPQGVEVNWVWTGSLAAYARFYNQRTDPHAQLEVQQLACEVGAIVEPLFPLSWKALTNGL